MDREALVLQSKDELINLLLALEARIPELELNRTNSGKPRPNKPKPTSEELREFFNGHVLTNKEDWRQNPYDEFRAINTVGQANNMAERLALYYEKKPREYREDLTANECSDFGLVWDIADSIKHVSLDRDWRRVSRADQTAFNLLLMDDWKDFDAVADVDNHGAIMVTDDDGLVHDVAELMENVIEMFKRILEKM